MVAALDHAPFSNLRPGSPPPPDDPRQWFATHVYAHDRKLKAYLHRSFPSLPDIDDIAQESYLRVWRRHLERPIVSAQAFLYKVAARLALDAVRRNRNCPIEAGRATEMLNGIDEAATVSERACVAQEIELLYEAIGGLPARCREIVMLRKIHGVPQKEIARRLRLSEQTVQGQACRGLRRCGELLARRGVARATAFQAA